MAQQTATNTPANGPIIHTSNGDLRGVTAGEVSSFKGIPYAAAPVGEFRWRPPQPVVAWKGVRDATQYGASAAQVGFPRGADSISKTSKPDPKKARLDVIEKAVTSGNLH
ncbi:MAG: carboxylesterase family protein [Ferruginibacter sp.]|uniref:carboxylesterase family protein n=1 Tax=Ferruginibacter sp. TaxID=1940288 RepID=UPI00265942A9|nr:carboxylesterase family protein [Ferruginibacter sp.]MDB5276321.1 carboxylesterase family protein [Ferruginibacter sp.]